MKKAIITTEGKTIYRRSRWIKIQHSYNVSKRNGLYYYATDENGYTEGSAQFDPENGLYLDFFRYGGRNYAINQFLRLDFPIMWNDEDGKTQFLSGYDSENYYSPIMIEIADDGETVRIYED